jgi:guanyl-specific ribonuclease Sa
MLRLGAGIGVAGLLSIGAVQAREEAPSLPTVSVAALPAEAQAVQRSIHRGGPFAFPKDGIVFANRERLLPPQWRGYYREYTVPTPGAMIAARDASSVADPSRRPPWRATTPPTTTRVFAASRHERSSHFS